MVICLEQGAGNLHMIQLMPLPPIISCGSLNSGVIISLCHWCWLTQVDLEKRPLWTGIAADKIISVVNQVHSIDPEQLYSSHWCPCNFK